MTKLDMLRFFRQINKDNNGFNSVFCDRLENYYENYSDYKKIAYYNILSKSYNNFNYNNEKIGLGCRIINYNTFAFTTVSYYFNVKDNVLYMLYDSRYIEKVYKIKVNKKDYKIVYRYDDEIDFVYIDDDCLLSLIFKLEEQKEKRRAAALNRYTLKMNNYKAKLNGIINILTILDYNNEHNRFIENIQDMNNYYKYSGGLTFAQYIRSLNINFCSNLKSMINNYNNNFYGTDDIISYYYSDYNTSDIDDVLNILNEYYIEHIKEYDEMDYMI